MINKHPGIRRQKLHRLLLVHSSPSLALQTNDAPPRPRRLQWFKPPDPHPNPLHLSLYLLPRKVDSNHPPRQDHRLKSNLRYKRLHGRSPPRIRQENRALKRNLLSHHHPTFLHPPRTEKHIRSPPRKRKLRLSHPSQRRLYNPRWREEYLLLRSRKLVQ